MPKGYSRDKTISNGEFSVSVSEESIQTGILQEVPAHCRYLECRLKQDVSQADVVRVLTDLQSMVDGETCVLGLGASLLQRFDVEVQDDLHFNNHQSHGLHVPATPQDLMLWVRGEDVGTVHLKAAEFLSILDPFFYCEFATNGFKHREGRDLTGYEDGTENPEGEEAIAAVAFDDGSTVMALQKWVHNLAHFKSLAQNEQDDIIGRRLSDNEEFDEAPASAHVKRAAQENFEPEAFMLRRSMAFAEPKEAGLMFASFSRTAEPFNQIMNRMIGLDDGLTDHLFRFSQPVTGAFYWCPPMVSGRLDLSKLSI